VKNNILVWNENLKKNNRKIGRLGDPGVEQAAG